MSGGATPTSPDARGGRQPPAQPDAVAVISAYGAFRLLVVLLGLWSFVEGFALFTGGPSALRLGGGRTAEQVVGLQLVALVPVYGLLAWRRDRYRLLIWLPYAAQLAIIVPTALSLLQGDRHGLMLLVISLTFLALLFYFWWHSHPLEFFRTDEGGDGEDDEGPGEDDGHEAGDGAPPPPPGARGGAGDPARDRRYRRLPPHA